MKKYLKIADQIFFDKDRSFEIFESPEFCQLLSLSSSPGELFEYCLSKFDPELRKARGMFFTPYYAARRMVEDALDIWQKNNPQINDLKSVKIIDPACGAGEFLLAALDVLLDLRLKLDPEKNISELKLEIINNNLYGIDIDKNALNVLYSRLKSIAGEDVSIEHFINADSLFTDRYFGGRSEVFDLVIGNPPYVSYGLRDTGKLSKKNSALLRKKFPDSAEYKISTYALFMELAIRMLKPNGVNTFIVPDSFLTGQYFTRLRNYILSSTNIERIILSDEKLFAASVGRSVIYYFTKSEPLESKTFESIFSSNIKSDNQSVYLMRQDEFKGNFRQRFRLFFDDETHNMVTDFEKKSVCRLKDLVTLSSGLIARKGKKSIIAFQPLAGYKKALSSGRSIHPDGTIHWDGCYINPAPELIKSGLAKVNYYTEKIFIRQTGDRIVAAVDKDHLLALNNLHIAVSKVENLDLKRLADFLNSPEMVLYYQAVTLEKGRTMAQIDLETLREIPLPERFELA